MRQGARGLGVAARVGLAGLALGLGAAVAGASEPVGNDWNPSGTPTASRRDPRGLTHLREAPRRSPSGFLYAHPKQPARLRESPLGWKYAASLEYGAFWDGGDEDEARFETYTDRSDEAFANSFALRLARPKTGIYADVEGGGVGREDAYARFELGLAGRLRLRAFFDEVSRFHATDARSLLRRAARGTLRLPNGLTPGDNSDAEIAQALESVDEQRLSVERETGGISLRARLLEGLDLRASYTLQDRRGERPSGGGFVFDLGSAGPARVVETVEPIDAGTHTVSASLGYRGDAVQANLSYEGSFFRNESDTLTFDNPFRLPSLNPSSTIEDIQRGRLALAPDNRSHNVRGEWSVRLPWRGRLTTTLSWTRMEQNDDLIPPTVNSGTFDTLAFQNGVPVSVTVDLDDWNTPAALPRDSADAKVDTALAHATLHVSPLRALRVTGRVRYFLREDRRDHTALNPLTGQIGYISEDGGPELAVLQNRVFLPGQPTDDWRFRAVPLDRHHLETELEADYRLAPGLRVGLALGREDVERENREREETREHHAAFRLTGQWLGWLTARASYAFSERNGSSFELEPRAEFFVSSLPGFVSQFGTFVPPRGLAELRRPALADRDRQEAELRVNVPLRDDMDVALALDWREDDYGASFGLTDERSFRLHLDWSWQPTPRTQAYAFFGFDGERRRMANINDSGPRSADGGAGGEVFPLDRAWDLETRERARTLGAGVSVHPHERVELRVDYRLSRSEAELDHEFASTGALAAGLSAAEAGDRLPDLRLRDQALDTRIRMRMNERVAVAFYHRLTRSNLRDWHQTDLVPQVDGALFLGHVDEDFEASQYGVTVQVRF